jgi:hypothetical protein
MEYKPKFKIRKLVKSAKHEHPDDVWLRVELSKIQIVKKESEAYYYTIDKSKGWSFKGNIVLDDTIYGTVVLDILEGNVIGGIELISRIGY